MDRDYFGCRIEAAGGCAWRVELQNDLLRKAATRLRNVLLSWWMDWDANSSNHSVLEYNI